MNTDVTIQSEDFSADRECAELRAASRGVGAVVTFSGIVRDINDDDSVSSLYLEHYPGMTEKSITEIAEIAHARWSLQGVRVIHRVGELGPGDQIVFVGIASGHRGDAFAACQFVMDYLKTRAPFWKRETTPAGDRWLTTRETDFDAAKGWDDGTETGKSA